MRAQDFSALASTSGPMTFQTLLEKWKSRGPLLSVLLLSWEPGPATPSGALEMGTQDMGPP